MLQIISVLIGFILGLFTTVFNAWIMRSRDDRDQAIRAYRGIMGMKIPWTQAIYSRAEAYIFFCYHEHKWQLAGSPSDDHDFKQSERWQQISESGVGLVTDATKAIFEYCATLSIYFRENKTIQDLLDNLYNYPQLSMPDFSNATNDNLAQLKDSATSQAQQLVDDNHARLIDALLAAVSKELF